MLKNGTRGQGYDGTWERGAVVFPFHCYLVPLFLRFGNKDREWDLK